jgi:hypothetical protein
MSRLIRSIKTWERSEPGADHYVGWPDMDEARRLEQAGYLKEGRALGCFYITPQFIEAFGI